MKRMTSQVPNHIAIIPDGNRRWAKGTGIPFTKGYERGTAATHEIIEAAFQAGVPYLTVWASSEDNLLKRSKQETRFLLALFRREFGKMLKSKTIFENRIRVCVIGQFRAILKDAKLNAVIEELEEKTKHFPGRTLTILLGYDGKQEMIAAIKKLRRSKETIDEQSIRSALWTGALPSVDLAIRTGGEPHWSAGFLMWLIANSEFYFSDTFWPAFGKKEFTKALSIYASRRRMLGK